MTSLQKFGYASLASLVTVTQTFAATPSGFFGARDDAADFQTKTQSLPETIKSWISWLLGFITLIAVIYALWAGWNIMTAGGDEEKVKKARTTLIQVTIGIIVMWLSYSIVTLFMDLLSQGT